MREMGEPVMLSYQSTPLRAIPQEHDLTLLLRKAATQSLRSWYLQPTTIDVSTDIFCCDLWIVVRCIGRGIDVIDFPGASFTILDHHEDPGQI